MRILKRIKSEDNLAEVFNKYIGLLHTVESIKWPCYTSMKEYNDSCKEPSELARTILLSKGLYDLIVLNESLHSLHDSINRAIKTIEKFQDKYNSDWINYAINERMISIQEGGGDEDDYDDLNNVLFKHDLESIKNYTVKCDLKQCFFDSDNNGEYIGSSSKSDFHELSLLVENNSQFSIIKFFESQGHPINIIKVDSETGERIPQTMADRIESEMNEDIANKGVVELFNLVFDKCEEAYHFYKEIPDLEDRPEQYDYLKNQLLGIINIQ